MLPAPCLPDEEARLRRLQSLDLLDTGAEEALDAFTRLAASVSGMSIALISLVDHDRQWFKSAVGLPQGAQTSREVSFCGHALARDGIFEIEDATQDERFADNPLVTGAPYVVHYAGVPLRMPDGERIGTLCLIDHQPGKLSERDRTFLAGLGETVVATLLLRESERHLRKNELLGYTESLAEFSPVGLFATDADGAVVHANSRWLRLLGLHDLAEGLGWAWMETLDVHDQPDLRNDWNDAVRHRRALEVELCTLSVRHEPRWLRLRLEPADPTISSAAFIGVVVDISETRNLQLQLQERNEILQSVVDHLPCGMAVFDARLGLLARNDRLAELLDIPSHVLDADGASFETITTYQALRGDFGPGHPDTLAQTLVNQVRREGICEKRKCADGSVLDIRTGLMPGGGQVQIYTDVTAEKRAVQALRASEQKLALALEASGQGLWELAPQTRDVFLSESWCRFFGYTSESRVVKLEQMADLAPAYATQACRSQLAQLLKGQSQQLYLEHEMQNAAGETVWVITRCQVSERDASGRVLRVIGTTKDVTERHQAQATLHEAVALADQASRAKADFLATMSHEIRTPINGVLGLARLLEDCDLPEQEQGYVRMINGCASTLLALVNDVLDFSKIEARQMELEHADTDLLALLQETSDIFTVRAREKNVSFSVHLDPAVPQWVRADANRLRQILLNLLGNALKFTSSGGFSLHTSTIGVADGSMLRFDITDTGIGISTEGQARLFKRFSQADVSATRSFHGTGLGLAIARDLAVLMGGDVTVASKLGVGSTFTLTVPLVAAERRAPAIATGGLAPAERTDAAILVVEDNAINQLVARTLLGKLGYRDITIAEDGAKALAACQDRAFDLVLMDCQMPVMDGFQATRALRAAGFTAPIIALTASAVTSDRDECLGVGMDDYLHKPIDGALLSACVGRWLAAAPAPASMALAA